MEPFDCERIGDGWLAQPVNSISSLAFAAVAALLWVRGLRFEAGVIAVAGAGSIWFHSSPSGAAEWLHDVGLYAAVAVAAIALWKRLAAASVPYSALGVFAIGLVVWFFSRSEGAVCDPDSLLQGHALWHVLAATAYYLLLTTGEPRQPG